MALVASKRLWPVAREGAPFIWVGFGLTSLAWIAHWERTAAILFLVTVWVIAFFRDPERTIQAKAGELLSPADGKILSVETVQRPRYVEGPRQKISIFMSVFNCHVNRIPITGTVKKIRYSPGRFLMGFSEKASWENEHNAVVVENKQGIEILFIQIAGLIARRIVSYLQEGDHVNIGQRFGMIRFGSRCDVYLPMNVQVAVVPGDRVKAGLNVIARLP